MRAALTLAQRSVQGIDASRRAQLIGELTDRLDETDSAFEAFTDMNRLGALTPAAEFARSLDFPGAIRGYLRVLTPPVAAAWSRVPSAASRSPVFLVGFPWSGTTLLDTLLMNLPELEVLEEMPMVEHVETLLGDANRLGSLSEREIERLRFAYFDKLRELKPRIEPARKIVDKFPLHLVRAPLIHRLFPDARFVMVERHPCDVVLSCFMARFQTNRASVHFHDLESAARLYDLAMRVWTRSEDLLALQVHRVRYERMVVNLADEIRPLLEYLDVPWRDAVLDNQHSAMQRGQVPTASYAQVTEPIYSRASGRWLRYRGFLEPVMAILAPWAERMNYSI